jgi:hypothetical protein
MSRRRMSSAKESAIDEARIVSELEAILSGAREAGAWAPALRAVELLGRHIGLWRTDAREEASLAELIIEAVEKSKAREDGRDDGD